MNKNKGISISIRLSLAKLSSAKKLDKADVWFHRIESRLTLRKSTEVRLPRSQVKPNCGLTLFLSQKSKDERMKDF